jgi:hypothetical protein
MAATRREPSPIPKVGRAAKSTVALTLHDQRHPWEDATRWISLRWTHSSTTLNPVTAEPYGLRRTLLRALCAEDACCGVGIALSCPDRRMIAKTDNI